MLEIADKVIEGVKAVREIARRMENAELLNKIADLIINAADLKLEQAQQKTELLRLQSEIERMKQTDDLRKRLVRKNGVLHLAEPDAFYGDGPFCALCFENTSKLMQVFANHDLRTWVCPNCAKSVGVL